MSLPTGLTDPAPVAPRRYDETVPWAFATATGALTANALYLTEADNRDTGLTVGVIRLKVGATTNGNLKVAVYTYDGTTWTLLGPSDSTAVGSANTVQAVSLSSAVVVPRGVRRFYGLVTDGTATFFRIPGTDAAMGFLEPDTLVKTNSFTLPTSFVVGDPGVSSNNLCPWLRASAS